LLVLAQFGPLARPHARRTVRGTATEQPAGWLAEPTIRQWVFSRLVNTPALPPSWNLRSTEALARGVGKKLAVAQ